MATVAFTRPATTAPRAITRATGESPAVRWTLTAVALVFLALTLLLPLVLVFHEALAKGVETYLAAVREQLHRICVRRPNVKKVFPGCVFQHHAPCHSFKHLVQFKHADHA